LQRIDENHFYILVGDMLHSCLFLFVPIAILKADNIRDVNIQVVCIGIILFIIGMYIFLSSVTFYEFIIYKNRVVIKRFFVKDQYM
jgi:hypothetical protein